MNGRMDEHRLFSSKLENIFENDGLGYNSRIIVADLENLKKMLR
jgi:hypothetical protein